MPSTAAGEQTAAQPDRLPPPPLVALVAWVLPGAGYVLIGQLARGLTVGITVLALFVGGMLIGGIRVIDSPWIESPAQRTERETRSSPPPNAVQALLAKPWFIGQLLTGPVALVANKVGVSWERPRIEPDSSIQSRTTEGQGAPIAHSRVFEIGTLYTAVAGMLNLLAIIDSAYRAGNRGNR